MSHLTFTVYTGSLHNGVEQTGRYSLGWIGRIRLILCCPTVRSIWICSFWTFSPSPPTFSSASLTTSAVQASSDNIILYRKLCAPAIWLMSKLSLEKGNAPICMPAVVWEAKVTFLTVINQVFIERYCNWIKISPIRSNIYLTELKIIVWDTCKELPLTCGDRSTGANIRANTRGGGRGGGGGGGGTRSGFG